MVSPSTKIDVLNLTANTDGVNHFSSGIQSTTVLTQTQYTLTDLGILICPQGINNQGQIVGEGKFAATCFEPALWDSGNPIRLGTISRECGTALDVNENGQVVGYDQDAGGKNQAFLWSDSNLNGQSDPGDRILLGTLGGGPLSPGQADQTTSWGGLLVDYFQITQPGGTDDPTSPEPLPKLSNLTWVYLPQINH